MKAFYEKFLKNSFVFCLVWAFGLNLLIETLARKGFNGILWMLDSPVVFFYNCLIIFATLIVATLFRRRVFFITLITTLWLAIGVTNGIILTQRLTPFTMKDLTAMTDGLTILTNYFTIPQLAGIAAAIIVVLIAFVVLWIKAPKKKDKVNWKRNVTAAVLVVAMSFSTTFGLIQVGVLSTFFGSLPYAYADYGVPYCFINTWLNTGIPKPAGYSADAVKDLFDEEDLNKEGNMELVQQDVDQDHPNIIFLQLESFIDPTLFTNIELSEDPIPFFRTLMSDYSSGDLTVPACGAGTANTEFEVMTGLSVKFFGPGEYPFKAILKDVTAESIATDLKSMGFGTHAIHNHRGMFYNRHIVFDNIGYDTFTCLEYMSDVPKTPKNWAKDSILTGQIMMALESTKTHDYIYTISVQGHGKYPSEEVIKNPKIKVTDAPSQETKWQYEYYVNQIYEMDLFLKDLIGTLEKWDEDVVLVLYGDHIPALDVTEDSYAATDLYTTQYVVWNNFGMEKEDENLTTFQLAAEVFDRLDIHTGTTVKYHQNTDHDDPEYLSNLKMLGYDMLYGQHYIYGGENPFEKAGMRMGIKEIKIDSVVHIGGQYYIKGQNFTEKSKVTLDGEPLKTIYLGPEMLGLLEEVDPERAKDMKVSQIDTSNKEIISTTE